MEYLGFFKDFRLVLLFGVSALISLLSCTTIATRIAAVNTKKVAMAFAVYNIFFLVTRFANLFYLPYLGIYIDRAEQTQNFLLLEQQIRFLIYGNLFGTAVGWFLLPSFVEFYQKAIEALDKYKSMVKVIILFITKPANWIKAIKCFKAPSFMGAKFFKLEGAPANFLIFNMFATAIWTVGALCALYASGVHPEVKRTAVLLSGLVNALAAIFFSVIVDPKASLITDNIVKGETKEEQIYAVSLHLMLGNVLGAVIAQFFFMPGANLISSTAVTMGNSEMTGNYIILAIFNALVMLKSSTTYSSRISAVKTRSVATAIAIYNFFFLLTRLSQQIFAPFIGTMVDSAVKHNLPAGVLEGQFRWLIGGSTLGALLGFILLPTFVEIYVKAIRGMTKYGSLDKLILMTCIKPSIWLKAVQCFRMPSFMGVKLSDMKSIPRNFLIANIIVISFHTVGVLAATFASFSYPDARGVTLLSSVINGVATILLSLLVDPTIAVITDNAIDGKRPFSDVCSMAVFLALGTVIGTIISQIIFMPSVWFIQFCSSILGAV